jgi:hypothetical protein
VVIRAVALAVAGLAIYLLLPSLTRVLASWPRLLTLDRVWLAVVLAAEVASFTCTFALQRLALQTRQWFSVVTAGLAGNSVSGILPGGAAAGAGLQFEMLSHAGFDTDAAPWPTGSPPTGFRWAPDRRPTCCTGTATAAGTPGPAQAMRHNGEGRTAHPRRHVGRPGAAEAAGPAGSGSGHNVRITVRSCRVPG